MQALGDVFSAFAAALGAADKVIEMIQREPQMPAAGALRPAAFEGRLELQGVDFCYPGRPATRVLSGVSLQVNPGQVGTLLPGWHLPLQYYNRPVLRWAWILASKHYKHMHLCSPLSLSLPFYQAVNIA